MRKLVTLLLTIFLILSCISCNGQSKTSNATLGQTASGAETVKAETSLASATPVPQAVNIGKFRLPQEGVRPFAVMIDNQGKKVLPQGGLDLAQVIYEIVVEGGETRYMPVFWGVDPTMIGPVRSSRHYFLDYAMENDAIYVHFGWSPQAQKDISALKINNINGVTGGGVIFWDLTKDRGNWQDSYTSMKNISEYVNKVKYRTSTDKKLVFSYNQSFIEPTNGQIANKINIKYTSSVTCAYEYDNNTMLYKRFRNGEPHMERVSSEQLTTANILIQYTPNSTIKGDDKGRQEVTTVGSGNGYYISKGKAIKIKWSKQLRSSRTEYKDEAGNPITLNPGQTWIQIMPMAAKLTIE